MSSSYQIVVEAAPEWPGVVRIVGSLPPAMTKEDVMALGMAVVDVANAAGRDESRVTSAQVIISFSD